MNRKEKTSIEIYKNNERFLEACRSLEKMREEIAPFIKPKVSKKYSTEGEWCETSTLCFPSTFEMFDH